MLCRKVVGLKGPDGCLYLDYISICVTSCGSLLHIGDMFVVFVAIDGTGSALVEVVVEDVVVAEMGQGVWLVLVMKLYISLRIAD